MRWDEQKFGLEYDLDIFNVVAVNDFNMGAMENKGLNVFNTAFVLAKPGTIGAAGSLSREGGGVVESRKNINNLRACQAGYDGGRGG